MTLLVMYLMNKNKDINTQLAFLQKKHCNLEREKQILQKEIWSH